MVWFKESIIKLGDRVSTQGANPFTLAIALIFTVYITLSFMQDVELLHLV